MSYQIVKLYKAYETDGEGMGYDRDAIGYYTTKHSAENARGDNPYSGVKEEAAILVDHEYYLLKQSEPILVDECAEKVRKQQLRQSGLAKLTAGERKALGL